MKFLNDFDPRHAEILDVRYRKVCKLLTDSYDNKNHTIRWALLVFVVTWIVLLSIGGVGTDSLYSALAALFWAIVHNVRRV